jgi:hypothetical protein
LAKIKDEFHLLAESMPQIVWITLSNGMNIYNFKQWVEYRSNIRRKLRRRLVKPFHRKTNNVHSMLGRMLFVNNAEYSLECRLRQKDGDYFGG